MPTLILLALKQDKDSDGFISQTEVSEYLGLGYLSAYLKEHSGCGYVEVLSNFDISYIINNRPLAVGFSVMASNYEASKKASIQLKKEGPSFTEIIWGGPQATTYHDEVLLEDIVDYVVLGEGEKTTAELMKAINLSRYSYSDADSTTSVKGIAYKKDEKVVRNPPNARLSTADLDSIDFTKIHHGDYIGLAKHLPHSVPWSEMRFANVVGSRGCWNDCGFCSSKTLWGGKITYRTPENIVDELEFLVKKRDVNYVFFADDDFLVNGAWASKIAAEITKRNIHVKYHVMASVRSASRFNNYEVLKRSGCAEITVGMETANQDILNQLGKSYETSALLPVANEIVSHGIHFGLYYVLGYPQQNIEDLDNDYAFIESLPFSRIRASFITPFPGTRFYDEVEQKSLWLDGYRNKWELLTCDRPVVKSVATPEELVEARKKIVGLHITDKYETRMKELIGYDVLGQKALSEFQEHMHHSLKCQE